MAELEIEGSFDEQWGVVKAAVKQHNAAINGNGQPGLLDFMSGVKAQYRLLLVMISVVGLIVSILAVLEVNHQIHTGQLHIANEPTLAKSSQDANTGRTSW